MTDHEAAVAESMEETLAILGDPEAMAGIRDCLAAVARGEFIEGEEAIRALGRRTT